MDSSDQNVLSNQIAGMSVGTFRSTTTLFTHTHTRTTYAKTTTHTHNHTTLTTTTYSTQLLTHTRHLAPVSVMLFGSCYLLRLQLNKLFSNSEAAMLSTHTSNWTFQKINA